MQPENNNTPPLIASAKRTADKPPVAAIRLPLPKNWREMRAREVFDLSRPLLEQLPPFEELPPELRPLVEQAERYKQQLPEFRFPELLKADEAAHISYYQNGVRAPLPEGWERYGRTSDQWEVRGYEVDSSKKEVASSWLDLPISMVSSAIETKTYPTTCGEVLAGIRFGKWAKLVKRVRDRYLEAFKTAIEEGKPDPAAVAKKTVHAKKRDLPAVTFSGAFSERVDSAIESHSGFICVDVDNCEDPADIRAELANDPFIQAAFISPTGTGCKALVRIPPQADAHAQSFAAARKHFKDAYEITIDESCKNVSRLCYVAHDPGAFIRSEDARLLEPLPEEQPPPPKAAEAAPGDLEGLMFLPKTEFTT